DRVLPERARVDHGAQRTSDEPGDLVRAPADALAHRLAVRAGRGRARQHRVLGGDPAVPRTLAPAGHPLGEGGLAQHLRAAELDEDAALPDVEVVAGDGHGAQLVRTTTVRAGG